MDAVKFLEELHRMCLATDGCRTCAIRHVGSYCPSYLPKIEETVAIVEKWSSEHPRKTRLQDFLEKCPNAPLTEDGLPFLFPLAFGYCNELVDPTEARCYHCKYRLEGLKFCWNLPLEE